MADKRSPDIVSLLDQAIADTQADVTRLRAAELELDRLLRARAVMVDSEPAPAAPAPQAQKRAPKKRAARGSLTQGVVAQVAADPGATVAQIADAIGADPTVVRSATARLVEAGRLIRVSLGTRRIGFRPPDRDETRLGVQAVGPRREERERLEQEVKLAHRTEAGERELKGTPA